MGASIKAGYPKVFHSVHDACSPCHVAKELAMLQSLVPLMQIDYGSGHIIIRSPYTLYCTYLRGL